MTPTARTLKECKKLGYIAEVCEHYNCFTHRRHDLFNFIDVLALSDNKTIGIQCTTTAHQADRVKKIIHDCTDNARAWLAAGNTIEVWGWGRYKHGKAHRWRLTRREVCGDELAV